MEVSEAFIQPSSKKIKLQPKSAEQVEKPLCLYGSSCFRRSPAHLRAYRHPKKENSNTPNLPPCKYGAQCYDRNLLHFAMYYHPTIDACDNQPNVKSNKDLHEAKDTRHSKGEESISNECLIEQGKNERLV